MKKEKYLRHGRQFQTNISLYLMMFSCIPVLILWLVQQGMTSQMLKNQMLVRKQTEFSNFSRQMDELIDQQKLNLMQFIHDEDVQAFLGGQEDSVYRVNYKLQLVFGADKERVAVYVIPKGKQPAAGTLKIPVCYQYPYNKLDWGIFRKLNKTTAPVFYLNGRRDGGVSGTVFSIARTVIVNDEVIGYIIIDMNDFALESFFPEEIQEKGNNVYLYDEWGFVCYSSDRSFQGRDGIPDYIAVHPGNQAQTRLPSGELIGILRQYNEKTGLTILGELPFYRISKMVETLNQMVSKLLFVCMLLSIAAAIWTSHEIVNPLNIILEHIHKLQQGDFSDRIDSERKDEFGEVMRAFDGMTEKLNYYLFVVEEKQKNLRLAEMKNLQAQIRPHFLYNTLDLIKWNIRLGEDDRAVSMLTNLGKLLRSTVDCNDYVRVEEELLIVRRYLEIWAVHYNDHLRVEWEIADEINEQIIPKLVLQPVVENCVLHGLSPGRADNWIKISCRQKDGYLIFHVIDNGVGIPAHKLDAIRNDKTQSESIGIANVDSRLRLFGDESCGVFYQDCTQGASVRLVCKILVHK